MSAAVLRVSHFDLDKIAASGQCFRWEKLYTRKYRIPAGDACAYVTQTGDTLTVDDQNVLTSSVEFWANYFAVVYNNQSTFETLHEEGRRVHAAPVNYPVTNTPSGEPFADRQPRR